MPGRLKMKCARLAVGYAKDDYWSDLPETIFGQMFNSARNQTLFFDPYSAASRKIFQPTVYSDSKIALPRYSRVSNTKLNGRAEEIGHWLTANFTFPAVTWKNVFWSFSMLLWCNEHFPGSNTSIHCFEFFAVLPVWLFWGQIYKFWLSFNIFGFFIFEKKPNEIFLWPIRFFCRIGRFKDDVVKFLVPGRFLDIVYGHRMINFYWKLCTRIYNFLFCFSCSFRFTLSGYSSARPKVSRSLLKEWPVSFILFMYKICIYCLLKARLGVLKVSLCIYLVFGFFGCYLALFTGWSDLFCLWLTGNPVFGMFVSTRTYSGVSSPQIWGG